MMNIIFMKMIDNLQKNYPKQVEIGQTGRKPAQALAFASYHVTKVCLLICTCMTTFIFVLPQSKRNEI